MPKNNSKARKAWRKAGADWRNRRNAAFWAAHTILTPEERLLFAIFGWGQGGETDLWGQASAEAGPVRGERP